MREQWARRIALLTGLLVFLLAAVFAVTQNPIEPPDSAQSRAPLPAGERAEPAVLDPQRIEAGREVYRQQTCARCHSIAGEGNPRGPLDGVGARRSADELRDWIIGAEALQGEIPERAFRLKQEYKVLSSDDLDALVIYMQSLRPESHRAAPAGPAAKPAAAPVSVPAGENGNCLACHGNAGHLMQVVKPPPAPPKDGCAAAPSRPAFLNAFVNREFTGTVHGEIGCTGCHGGDATAEEKTPAHAGMRTAGAVCAACHGEIAKLHAASLHGTLNGMAHGLKLRSGEENFHKLGTVWNNDCASCHASCSDCHVTLPGAVGGGLLRGHAFLKRPPMKETCAICHGTRAGAEYLGQWQGVAPDVHFEAGMHCLDCHKNDLHGDGRTYTDRWQVRGRPQCTDCHAALPNETAAAHGVEHRDASCQVCHAQPYQNCFSCHSGMEAGKYVRRAESKGLDFKIGRNTAPGYPHAVVTLRHNPVARNSFDHFGEKLLPHFDDYPTWKTAAPHNIRRVTSQGRSCESCHGREELFLRESDLEPRGSAANRAVTLPPAGNPGRGTRPQ
jgi:thiosulfate/3-mercaptopyruvate sulfurtransferase